MLGGNWRVRSEGRNWKASAPNFKPRNSYIVESIDKKKLYYDGIRLHHIIPRIQSGCGKCNIFIAVFQTNNFSSANCPVSMIIFEKTDILSGIPNVLMNIMKNVFKNFNSYYP